MNHVNVLMSIRLSPTAQTDLGQTVEEHTSHSWGIRVRIYFSGAGMSARIYSVQHLASKSTVKMMGGLPSQSCYSGWSVAPARVGPPRSRVGWHAGAAPAQTVKRNTRYGGLHLRHKKKKKQRCKFSSRPTSLAVLSLIEAEAFIVAKRFRNLNIAAPNRYTIRL